MKFYTYEEAQKLFAIQLCLHQGHEWQEIKNGTGVVISLHCSTCGATAEIKMPKIPEGREMI